MLQTLTTPFFRWLLACAVLFCSAALAPGAFAQTPPGAVPPPPPPPQQGSTGNPMCQRLGAPAATIDRRTDSGDPAKAEQIRRYQEAASRQQAELDRVTS